MELRQLEYFRMIADTGSIHEAARRLNMSQPPLSYQLRRLEDELNVRLFERTSRGVALTEAGKLLYSRSGDLLTYVRSTELEVAKAGRKRVLRLGITATTVGTMMPYLSAFTRLYPDVNFEIHDGITYTLYDALLEGIIDVSVVRTPLRLDGVEFAVLRNEPMIAVSSPALQAETEGTLPLSALLDRPLILYRRYEALIMDTFRAQGSNPDVFCLCDDARGAVLWAREGLATAVFPQSMSSLCEGLRVQIIDEPALWTQILLIWKRDARPIPAVRDFLEVCLTSENGFQRQEDGRSGVRSDPSSAPGSGAAKKSE